MTAREVRPMGDRALLVRGTPEEVRALLPAVDHAVASGELTGVEDVVAAESSLLVRLSGVDADAVARTLATLPVQQAVPTPSTRRHLEVSYDGPDLHAVADEAGLSAEAVVARHTAADYTVAFCGFAPGFAYLTGLDPALHLPRLPTPRTSVPAGSVAIAAAYAGVYPRSSPGGWRLLGRTDAILFDPQRSPPALLSPGDTVRFVPARGR